MARQRIRDVSRHAALASLMCIAMSGCAFSPAVTGVTEVDTLIPERFDDRVTRTEMPPMTAWWEQFGDPVLNTVVDSALAQNRDVRIAAARVVEEHYCPHRWGCRRWGAGGGGLRQQLPGCCLRDIDLPHPRHL
ncbi:MAG: hypothetical protein ACI80V_002266 [Rhodothermales bacterium]|jgi:hypothetical protein